MFFFQPILVVQEHMVKKECGDLLKETAFFRCVALQRVTHFFIVLGTVMKIKKILIMTLSLSVVISMQLMALPTADALMETAGTEIIKI